MRVSVIGQGYVGLSVAVGAASVGHVVVGVDSNDSLISDLKKSQTFVPGIKRELLNELITSGSYIPTTNLDLIQKSDVVIIAVPTPLDSNKKPDLSFLKAATLEISKTIKNTALIINESTSYPGTLRNLIKPIFDSNSKVLFFFASAPERIDPGNEVWKISNTPRIIAGLNQESTDKAIKFYKTFCSSIYQASSPEVAEAAKLFENSFRQINIALANEFSVISNLLGFSANEAIHAAATKPFGFMPFFPSIGVGGHCIPVDPSYLSYAAELVGAKPSFIELANQTNLNMVKHVVGRIKEELGGKLKGLQIQLAGIAYKPEVSDLRESPALLLIEELEKEESVVTWCDPLVAEYKNQRSIELNPLVDLGLIISPHKVIDLKVWLSGNTKVFDLSADANNYGWPKFL
jgi:UDP-N-acetyl-D-glucosamine dehydrogenase